MKEGIGGATRLAGVIGDPVAHSRSPAIHNAAYEALGLDWVYVAFPVPAGQAAIALEGVRALGIAGLSVTMPHKAAAAAACDELTPRAAPLGAINLVLNRDGTLVGDSTDGLGFVASLLDEGVEPNGASVVVVGSGGAARAMVLALDEVGADMTVADRHLEHAEAAVTLSGRARAIDFTTLDDAVGVADVVVNATPLGMNGELPPFDVGALTDTCFVFDAVYHPLETPLLAMARARGLRGANGLGMLVHQAVESFELITGVVPSYDVMRTAALAGPVPDG